MTVYRNNFPDDGFYRRNFGKRRWPPVSFGRYDCKSNMHYGNLNVNGRPAIRRHSGCPSIGYEERTTYPEYVLTTLTQIDIDAINYYYG